MCVNYKFIFKFIIIVLIGVDIFVMLDWFEEIWQDYVVFVVWVGLQGELEFIVGIYGMMFWCKLQGGLQIFIMNVCVEIIGEKCSYVGFWWVM